MVAGVCPPERELRGPGCTEACIVVQAFVPDRFGRSELLLHDAATHEAYGRVMAGPWPADEGVVRTGALVIDLWSRTVTAWGQDVAVSEREWEILEYLAARRDRFVSTPELRMNIWRTPWVTPTVVITTMSRLRCRLGDAGAPIETAPGRGYRLAVVPPLDGTEPAASVRRWATLHARCICCGRTTFPHNGHGRCTRCQKRGHRPPHYGPCAAPPMLEPGSDHDD